MTYQRRHGDPAIAYSSHVEVDARGNKVSIVDMDQPHSVTAVFVPQRSSRAELPGQMDLEVSRMLVDANIPGVDAWSRVLWRGAYWDVVTPPALHGSKAMRQSRHWSIDLRRRP